MFYNHWFYVSDAWVSYSFWLLSNYFLSFYWFCVFSLQIRIIIFLRITRISFFFLLICLQVMMRIYDESIKRNQKPNWPYIPDHLHRVLIIDGQGSGKTKVLLNLIQHQWAHIVKIHLYVYDWFESKYQLLINGREKRGIKKIKNKKTFFECSSNNWWCL